MERNQQILRLVTLLMNSLHLAQDSAEKLCQFGVTDSVMQEVGRCLAEIENTIATDPVVSAAANEQN